MAGKNMAARDPDTSALRYSLPTEIGNASGGQPEDHVPDASEALDATFDPWLNPDEWLAAARAYLALHE
jgi:hypothetical protein